MIELLGAGGYDVEVLGYAPSQQFAVFEHIPLPSPSARFLMRAVRRALYLCACAVSLIVRRGRLFERWLDIHYGWQTSARRIATRRYAIMVVEDLALLPMAQRLRGEAAVLFDAREYYPRQNEESLLFRLIEGPARSNICRDYLKRCDEVITVSPGLAAAFSREFQIDATVILSAPRYRDMPMRTTEPGRIRMVHHGAANRNRRLEDMIDVTHRLDDRFELDLYLTGSAATIDALKLHAAGSSRVRVLPPVPYEEIIPMLADYDIGLFFNIPTTFNLRNALPNKLFEFIQARLLIAIGPSPDMRYFVEKFACGVVASEPKVESMVAALQAITVSDIMRGKANSDLAARDLCFEVESDKLRRLIAGARTRREQRSPALAAGAAS